MKVFMAAAIVMFLSTNSMAWDIKITDKVSKKPLTQTVGVVDECVTIDIGGKTEIKVCKCGSVAVKEWKEIVPNKEAYFYNGQGVITLTPNNSQNYILTN